MEDPMIHMRGREEEEGEGEVVDLKKARRRLHKIPKSRISPTLSDNSSITSESSDISFEYFLSEQHKSNNGEQAPLISEFGAQKEEETFEEYEIMMGSNGVVSITSNEATNGISVHQNGLTAAYSHSGYQEVTASDKSPDGGVGLKDFGGMFDESSKNDSIATTDAYNSVEDIINKASLSVEDGNVNLDLPNDNPLPEVEEINVVREIRKQVFTLNGAWNSVENESVSLDLPKDNPVSEVEEIDVEREIQKQVFSLSDSLSNAENGSVNLDLPKDNPIPEVEEIDVEREIQNQVFTLNDALNSVENGSVNLRLPKDNLLLEIEEIDVEREIKKHVFTLNNASQNVENGSDNLGPTNDLLPEVVEEFDVERVIQKQETHDLYCPNCKSCITKRVILKRRKRKIQDISPSEDAGSSTLSDGIVQGIAQVRPPQVDEALEEPIYAMTCLSCFTIFLPSRNGWLGRIFGRKTDVPTQSGFSADSVTEPLLSPHGGNDGGVMDGAKLDDGQGHVFPLWIVGCCQPSDGKRPLPPSITVPRVTEPEPAQEQLEQQSEGNGDIRPTEHGTEPALAPPNGVEGSNEEIKPYLPDETNLSSAIEPLRKPDKYTLQAIAPAPPKPHLLEVPNGKQMSPVTENDSDNTFALWFVNICQPNKDGSTLKLSDKPDTPLPSKPESTPPVGTPVSLKHKPILEPELPLSSEPISHIGAELPHEFNPPTIPNEGTGVPLTAVLILDPGNRTPLALKPTLLPTPHDDVDARVPSKPTPALPGAGTPLAAHKPMPMPSQTPAEGGESIITISYEVTPRPLPLAPILDDIPHQAGPFLGLHNPLLEQGLRRPQGGPGIDTIKAIVYGGLLESITSLSIIASAAGGDATTLNIVALGLANMFGGLVLLFHSLRIMKREHATEHYIQELGRPGHFLLHATVAIISYIIFGLMAPIIYGFSFRKSDNKYFKLATLAAASFVSITVLSTAKAYVRNPPKAYIKTVLYYLCIGFMVSGLGYVAGDLINELLKKLGVFDPKSVVPEGGDIQGLLASY